MTSVEAQQKHIAYKPITWLYKAKVDNGNSNIAMIRSKARRVFESGVILFKKKFVGFMKQKKSWNCLITEIENRPFALILWRTCPPIAWYLGI